MLLLAKCQSVLGHNTEPQTAPDVLVGTLHGSHHLQCMNVCMNKTLNFRLLFNPHRGNVLVTIAGRQTFRHTISTGLRILKIKNKYLSKREKIKYRQEYVMYIICTGGKNGNCKLL